MTEPTTAAGRALLTREVYNSRSFTLIELDAILAIEGEARAAALDEARAAVEAFDRDTYTGPSDRLANVDAILAVIDALREDADKP